MAKICIVLATYNGEKYLSKMLDSLVSQTRPADLIIAVDDGSKDSSVQILESFKNRLPLQITAFSQNQGHRAAFSKALEIAQPLLDDEDYISLADQDDVWLPHKNEILLKEFEKGDKNSETPLLAYGDAQVVDQNENIIASSWRKHSHIQTKNSIKQQIAGINNVTGCLCMFRASLLKQILPIPAEVTVHDRWIAMLAHQYGTIKDIDTPVIKYRIHGGNAVGGTATPPMSKTLSSQIRWTEMIIANRTRLNLSDDEVNFAQKLLNLTKGRLRERTLFRKIPWIIVNRKDLFLAASPVQTAKRIFFSAIGLPLAAKIFGKN